MSVRTLSQLRSDQAAMLTEIRSERAKESSLEMTAETPAPVVTFGRVVGIVYFDPVLGSHLRVKPYEYVGTPPVATPTTIPEVKAYPTPNYSIFNYSINEWSLLNTTRGAVMADKMR